MSMNPAIANLSFFQIPKILMKQPGMTPSHVLVFVYLYDMLRQEPYCYSGYNKTNADIAENALVGVRQTQRNLNDLEWKIIRILLGIYRAFNHCYENVHYIGSMI